MAMLIQQLHACFFITFSFIISSYGIIFNVTVSLDGRNHGFKTITDAIAAAPEKSHSRFFIHVLPGIYKEHVEIPSSKTFIALIGDDALTTVIVDDRSNGRGFKTSDTATFIVKGSNFMAQSITFENSAGPQNHQAVAVLDEATETTYYKCRFLGFQDTLYAKGHFQFYKNCDIYGTVDFIFGYGTVLFQDCNIYGRLPNTTIAITAQSKDFDTRNDSGFSFQNCTVTSSPELTSNDKKNVKIFLGRPWRKLSTVVFMESFFDEAVVGEGWMEWSGIPVDQLFYAEFNNRGPGADVSKRVNWPGFHVINKRLATRFTVEKLINGLTWLPETRVPFKLGLLT